MAFQIVTFWPHTTVPEAREYYHDAPFSLTKQTKKNVGRRNLDAFAYESSVQGFITAKFVQFTAVTAQGAPCAYGNTAKNKVVVAASAANSAKVCGFSMQAQSTSTWGWIQTTGPNVYKLVTSKSAAIGSRLVKSSATAGMLAVASAKGSQDAWVCAIALQSDSGSFMAPGKAIVKGVI